MRAPENELKEADVPYRVNVSGASLCTFRIGGTVALVIEPRCRGELLHAVSLCQAARVPFEILGNGSNVLFEDGYLHLAVIRTTALDQIRVLPDGICVGCGVSLPYLCYFAARRGMSGLQAFCGIPGTLGGALAMNAGAHGKQISGLVRSVEILDLNTLKITTCIDFKKNASYRKHGFCGENTLFLSAELELSERAEPSEILAEMQRLRALRKATQPLDLPSAGCVFKRPLPDLPIGRFLDELGCKGMRVGGVEVSQKHAAFIVNRGGADAADVKKLMLEIQKKAEKERGMLLESEIRIISDTV